MKWMHALLLMLFITTGHTYAQYSQYSLQLKDKQGTLHQFSNPSSFLSDRAIARRARYQIPLDSSDLPVSASYLETLRALPNVKLRCASRWLNQVVIEITDASALSALTNLPFVQTVSPVAQKAYKTDSLPRQQKFNETIQPLTGREINSVANGIKNNHSTLPLDYGSSYGQLHIHQGEYLHQLGFTGKGIRIAILDAGFFGYKTNPAIDSVRLQQRVLGEWDFVKNDPEVNEDHPHGLYCFSIIAANKPGEIIGSAPHAAFYLLRTEDAATEYPVEEVYWAAAAEYADSAGADLIASSLGYSTFDDPQFNISYRNRNGQTSLITRAANLATRKGLIVTNSVGNSGNQTNENKYVMCPADGDSVCAVGAVDPLGNIAPFSSWGPNSAGKIKPNIVSVGQGTVLVNTSGAVSAGNGTSFSNPLACGLIACLWQAFPEFKNLEILDAVERSAHRFTNPDDRYGYGIPDFKKAYQLLYQKRELARVSGNLGAQWLKAYPVPFHTQVQLVLKAPQSGKGTLRLMDLSGRTIEMITGNYLKDQLYLITLPSSAPLQPGIYLIEYQDGTNRKVLKTIRL